MGQPFLRGCKASLVPSSLTASLPLGANGQLGPGLDRLSLKHHQPLLALPLWASHGDSGSLTAQYISITVHPTTTSPSFLLEYFLYRKECCSSSGSCRSFYPVGNFLSSKYTKEYTLNAPAWKPRLCEREDLPILILSFFSESVTECLRLRRCLE